MRDNHLARSQGPAASGLAEALARVRDLYPDMTVAQLEMFLRFAATPGASQTEVRAAMGAFSDSRASRTVAILGSAGDRKTQPLHLLEAAEDPRNRNYKRVFLTAKGRRLVEDITASIGKGPQHAGPS